MDAVAESCLRNEMLYTDVIQTHVVVDLAEEKKEKKISNRQ